VNFDMVERLVNNAGFRVVCVQNVTAKRRFDVASSVQ
jgi:hypothetical protein